MPSYLLNEVFGTSRTIPHSYTDRTGIDDLFIESIKKQRHIVIYGSSKQGKTSLRKKHLKASDYVTITCNDKQTVAQLNQNILKQAGFQFISSKTETISGSLRGGIEAGIKLLIKAKGDFEGSMEKQTETNPLEIDPEDVNDVIKALQSINFNKIILLEDFHYLNPETQKTFANNLKTFYDDSDFTFIILGAWVDKNRLITLNGDLASRLISINVDNWNIENLKQVIKKGCDLLNIVFDDRLIEDIIHESFDNVYYVQEMCHKICGRYKIEQTLLVGTPLTILNGYYDERGNYIETEVVQDNRFYIRDVPYFNQIAKEIAERHSGRYQTFITQFSEIDSASEIKVSKWIIRSIVNSDITNLQEGIPFHKILNWIKENNPESQLVSEKAISYILKQVISFQFLNNIRPIIIDYEEGTKKVNIVDKEFIIWLSFQEKKIIEKLIE